MDANSNRLWLLLSWAWVAILIAYMAWGVIEEAGLYAWLVDWQVRRWDQYYTKLTAAIPVLLLGAPAFWYLRRHDQAVRARVLAGGPAAEARHAARNARVTALAGLALLAVGVGAYLYSQTIPAQNAPPASFDAAGLDSGAAPEGPVRIRGAIDPDAGTGVVEEGRGTDRTIFYVGFRPDGAVDKDGPFRLFIERRAGSSADAVTTQAFLPEQEGWLVEDGLPALARRDLESRGIRIANPHWVLQSSAGTTPRDVYYVVAAVAAFLGFIFLLAGAIAAARARRQRRAAQAA